MQPDHYTPYIIAAYLAAVLILGAMALHVVLRYRAVRKVASALPEKKAKR